MERDSYVRPGPTLLSAIAPDQGLHATRKWTRLSLVMKSFNIHEAKTHLSRLVERVQAGEEIVIAKAGRPIARLVPIEPGAKPVKIGGLRPRTPVPDDFNTMFEAQIESMFAGASAPSPARRRK